MSVKPILDACCGPKMFWFDKENPLTEFVDIREVDEWCHGRRVVVNPSTVADFTDLPFDDETFHLVIFDPPHLRWAGKNGWLSVKYGSLDESWPEMLRKGFAECWRVLKTNGTLIFKWNEIQIPLSEILPLAPARPLIGNRRVGPKTSKTHWLVFFKHGEET